MHMKKKTAATPKFAAGLCFRKLFFIFLIGSVVGAIYEDVLIFIKTWYETGIGVWMLHRGVIYGPFNVIYGFGAAAMCWLLCHKRYENWQIFLYAMLLGGATEYIISFLQETFLGTISWDYSNYPLNINGRTTLPFMIVWGLLGLLLVRVVYPFVSDVIEKIPPKTGEIVFRVLLVFMVLDISVSWTALLRQTLRHQNLPAWTPVGEFYDKHYTDAYLERFYPNMVRLGK